MKSILIKDTTKEESREYIKKTFPCIADCDMCGLCKVFHDLLDKTLQAMAASEDTINKEMLAG